MCCWPFSPGPWHETQLYCSVNLRPAAILSAAVALAGGAGFVFQATALQFGTETVQKFELGANYALGPGIKAVGGAMLYNVSGPTNLVSGNAWVIMLGMDLRF